MPQVLSRSAPKKRALDSACHFINMHERRFWRGARELSLSRSQQKLLEVLVSSRQLQYYLPPANKHVRLSAQEALIDELQSLFASAAPEFKLLTLTWDAGLTFETAPSVDIAKMANQASAALELLGLNAVCAVEVDGVSRVLEGEPGRRLLFHVHGVCWTNGGPFHVRDKELLLTTGTDGLSFTHRWGVPPVRFTAKRQLDWSAVAGLGMYLLKAPRCLKKPVWRENLGRFKLLRAPPEEFRPATAVRLMDLHSRWDVREIVFGVGDGVGLVTRWTGALEGKCGAQVGGEAVERSSVERLWRRVYARTNSGCCAELRYADVRL
jgi:hypothetical protein